MLLCTLATSSARFTHEDDSCIMKVTLVIMVVMMKEEGVVGMVGVVAVVALAVEMMVALMRTSGRVDCQCTA